MINQHLQSAEIWSWIYLFLILTCALSTTLTNCASTAKLTCARSCVSICITWRALQRLSNALDSHFYVEQRVNLDTKNGTLSKVGRSRQKTCFACLPIRRSWTSAGVRHVHIWRWHCRTVNQWYMLHTIALSKFHSRPCEFNSIKESVAKRPTRLSTFFARATNIRIQNSANYNNMRNRLGPKCVIYLNVRCVHARLIAFAKERMHILSYYIWFICGVCVFWTH